MMFHYGFDVWWMWLMMASFWLVPISLVTALVVLLLREPRSRDRD